MSQKIKMSIWLQVDTTDFHVEALDLLSNHVACRAGIAFVAAIHSASTRLSVQSGLVILVDLNIQVNIKAMQSPQAAPPAACNHGCQVQFATYGPDRTL